jgi:hypothetical protein
MLGIKAQIMLFMLLALSLWALQTKYTSADLVAERKVAGNTFSVTTLSFANISTANFNQLVQFFATDGLVPGGFDAKTVRIEKQGEMDVQYSLQVLKKGGDNIFCKALDLQIVKRDLTEIYNGKLMDISLKQKLSNDDFEEWIFMISLNQSEEAYKAKDCQFDIYMRTYRNDPSEKISGIYATRTLTNFIKSGSW